MNTSLTKGEKLLLDLIGEIEAPQGYNTVYGNKQDKLTKPLTEWTVSEIINAKPSFTRRFGSSACGRYQFMKKTLESLVAEKAVSLDEVFTPAVQDRLGAQLLKRRGYWDFVARKIGVTAFGLRLAQEWASFPVLRAREGAHRPVNRGESYYAGDAQNKALVAPTRIEKALADVLAAEASMPLPEAVAAPRKVRKWAEEFLTPDEVEYIQQRLIDLGYHEVGLVDGRWTQNGKTAAAIELLQSRAVELGENVKVDGHYGPQTIDLLDESHGEKYRRAVSKQRATTTASDLARKGNPGVIKGRKIKFASILGVISTIIGATFLTWQQMQAGEATLPTGSGLLLGFLPGWVAVVAPIAFTFATNLYTAFKGQDVVDTSVERFREGIDNNGLAPQLDHNLEGFFGKIFGK